MFKKRRPGIFSNGSGLPAILVLCRAAVCSTCKDSTLLTFFVKAATKNIVSSHGRSYTNIYSQGLEDKVHLEINFLTSGPYLADSSAILAQYVYLSSVCSIVR